MKKFTAAAAAFVISAAMLTSFTSCSEEEKSSSASGNALVQDNMGKDVNVKENDLPFGATTTDLYTDTDNVPVSITYDNRFMTEEQARKISDYIYAVNTKDEALLTEAGYKPYIELIMSDYDCTSVKEYLDSRYDAIKAAAGGDFQFQFIIPGEFYSESDDESITGFNALDAKIKQASPDAEITERYMIKTEITFTVDGQSGEYSLSSRTGDTVLYIYRIDGNIYIL